MKSKAPLLLMEQMVMLLVFALAAALCLQAFVKSDSQSRQSEKRDRAAVLCQNAAETIRAADGNFNKAAEQLGLEFGQGSTMYCYYDENWEPVPGPDGGGSDTEWVYRLSVQGQYPDTPGLGKASISVNEERDGEGTPLFEIEVAWQMGTFVEVDDGTA